MRMALTSEDGAGLVSLSMATAGTHVALTACHGARHATFRATSSGMENRTARDGSNTAQPAKPQPAHCTAWARLLLPAEVALRK